MAFISFSVAQISECRNVSAECFRGASLLPRIFAPCSSSWQHTTPLPRLAAFHLSAHPSVDIWAVTESRCPECGCLHVLVHCCFLLFGENLPKWDWGSMVILCLRFWGNCYTVTHSCCTASKGSSFSPGPSFSPSTPTLAPLCFFREDNATIVG